MNIESVLSKCISELEAHEPSCPEEQWLVNNVTGIMDGLVAYLRAAKFEEEPIKEARQSLGRTLLFLGEKRQEIADVKAALKSALRVTRLVKHA